MYLDNIEEMCTDSQGYGEPYLEGNEIVFRVEKNITTAELIWPVQSGAYDDNYAAIDKLALLDNGTHIISHKL